MANPRNLDMFEYLSESLLPIIISSLPFQEAARTCVLSKQWRSIWYATKKIQFYESYFVKPHHSDAEKEHHRRAFLNFIQQWIQMHGERTADTFCLSFSYPQGYMDVMSKCVVFALHRQVKQLEIDFSDPLWLDIGEYRKGFYDFNLDEVRHELESLRLFSCNFTYATTGTGKMYNALHTLCLGWISLPADHLKSFLLKCPSLENLSLSKCADIGFLEISGAPKLKSLVIEWCNINLEAGILIDAQSLQFFKYLGRLIPFTVESSLTTLDEVILDFRIETQYNEKGQLLYNLLKEISWVRILSVCGYTLQVIPTADDPLMLQPQLERVRHLILKPTTLTELEYHGLTFFLDSCPYLEFLSIDASFSRVSRGVDLQPPYSLHEHQFMTTESYVVAFECVRNTLRAVEVKGYKGYRCTKRVLTYLLKYGRVLENMSIRVSEDERPQNLELAQRLLFFPRANPNVRISIA